MMERMMERTMEIRSGVRSVISFMQSIEKSCQDGIRSLSCFNSKTFVSIMITRTVVVKRLTRQVPEGDAPPDICLVALLWPVLDLQSACHILQNMPFICSQIISFICLNAFTGFGPELLRELVTLSPVTSSTTVKDVVRWLRLVSSTLVKYPE